MKCKLCNLPTPTPPIFDGKETFCCLGCREVYRFFGANTLLDSKNSRRISPEESVIPKSANEDTGLIDGADTFSDDSQEAFLRIEGMHCASCEVLLEFMLKKVDGIDSISTSYATSTAKVVYRPNLIQETQLPALFKKIGYQAYFSHEKPQQEHEDRSLLWMVCAVGLAGMVMMLNLAFFYPIDFGLVEAQELKPVSWLAFDLAPKTMFFLTTLLIFWIGFPIIKGAWIGFRTGVLNMDSLLIIAIMAAYLYSIGQLYSGSLTFYFDVSAIIVGVVTVGRYLENMARQTATQELSEILNHYSPYAQVIRDNHQFECHISELKAHDILVIQEGGVIPIDGQIIHGECAVDEALVTGESCPLSKQVGDSVLGGSTIIEGHVQIKIGTRLESRIHELAKLLWNVQSSAKGATGIGHSIANIFVPTVLALSIIITIWLLLNGSEISHAVLAGLTALIVSCPCTFGLAVPLTTATAISTALKKGIILSSADIFAKKAHYQHIALDKTGTLSNGKMEISKIYGGTQIVAYAAAVERLAKHPIATAIAELNHDKHAIDLTVHPGKGAQGTVDNHRVAVGSRALMKLLDLTIPPHLKNPNHLGEDEILSYVGWDGKVQGAFVTRDQKRPEWRRVLNRLKQKYRITLITGSAHCIGYDELIHDSFTEVPPEAKAVIVRQLQTQGKVVMVGDGSNDAPALANADLGIAFGTPTALAAEAADIVIPGSNLEKIFVAFEIISETQKRVKQNLGWALLYNAIAIPLALSGLLNPLFAAIAMGSSSLLVVWNSSRPLISQHQMSQQNTLQKVSISNI